MTVIAIVTSTKTGGIGINDALPWINLYTVKDAYDELAPGNVVLIGGSSYNKHEHIKGDKVYVYTRDTTFQDTEKVKAVSGTPEEIIARIESENPDANIILAGGANVFKTFYNLIDEWRVTYVNEPVVYNKDIDMTNVRYTWSNKRIVSSGFDNNKEFEIWHYTK